MLIDKMLMNDDDVVHDSIIHDDGECSAYCNITPKCYRISKGRELSVCIFVTQLSPAVCSVKENAANISYSNCVRRRLLQLTSHLASSL